LAGNLNICSVWTYVYDFIVDHNGDTSADEIDDAGQSAVAVRRGLRRLPALVQMALQPLDYLFAGSLPDDLATATSWRN
jgi:hypothetical protein